MAETSIQWTDHTINPIRYGQGHFCQKISPGCTNCYASRLQPRFGNPEFKGTGSPLPMVRDGDGPIHERLWLDETKLHQVLRRKKPTKYFWCDMTDLFGAWVPDEWIDRCFAVMAATPQHTHQVLTKRPERMAAYLASPVRLAKISDHIWPVAGRDGAMLNRIPLPNVWLGVSVENQQLADERIPLLLQCSAAVRFLSCEPLLGPVDLRNLSAARDESPDYVDALTGTCYTSHPPMNGPRIDWVIVGGESGPGARPCNVGWVRSLVRQCQEAQVPCFLKQLGANVVDECEECTPEYTGWPAVDGPMNWETGAVTLRDKKGGHPDEWPEDLRVRQFPEPTKGTANGR